MMYPRVYEQAHALAAPKITRSERDWSESKSQGRVCNFLRDLPISVIHPLDWFHVRNEGKRTGKQGGQHKHQGLTTGVVDLHILKPGSVHGYDFRAVYIEVKRADRTNHATREQLEFLERRRRFGDIAEVCYGHHEVIELLCICYGW